MRSVRVAHAEAAVNAIAGLVLIEIMLWAFGIAIALAWNLTRVRLRYGLYSRGWRSDRREANKANRRSPCRGPRSITL
jgi:hypothetical protein